MYYSISLPEAQGKTRHPFAVPAFFCRAVPKRAEREAAPGPAGSSLPAYLVVYIGIMTAPSGRIISGVQLPGPNAASIIPMYAGRRPIGTYA